jgi:hypothetical protein
MFQYDSGFGPARTGPEKLRSPAKLTTRTATTRGEGRRKALGFMPRYHKIVREGFAAVPFHRKRDERCWIPGAPTAMRSDANA